jgi:archaellum component FlaC
MKIKKKYLCFLAFVFFFACSTADTRTGRIRALEKRLDNLEVGESTNKENQKLAQKIDRGLNLFSQRINNIYSDQGQYSADLEEIARQLEQLKKEIKRLMLNQKKILQNLE